MKKMNLNRRHALLASVLGACTLSVGLISAPAMAQNNAKVLLSLIHI